ncbi:MAG TPA: hypothetical protein DHV51_02455 [Opitutae bacterium]|nr:hypothetical protein [Opitutae bacterium]
MFLDYQKKWIKDASAIKLMEKSRQVGVSWSTAYGLVRRHLIGERYDSWVSSKDLTLGRLFLDDCERAGNIFNMACDAGVKRLGRDVVAFSSGGAIRALSSNPDAQAGKRGTRVLDEFALHADAERLYSVAYPGTTWGGQLVMISTHRGNRHFFAKLIEEIRNGNPKNISHHRVTLQDALNQGLLERLKQKWPQDDARQSIDDAAYFDSVKRSCPDESTFLQEYMCMPDDDAAAFLPYDEIAACEYGLEVAWDVAAPRSIERSASFYLGMDIGRDHDLTAFWLLEKTRNCQLLTRKVIVLNQASFDAQMQILGDWMANPGVRRVCMDKTGMGYPLYEQAKQKYGEHRVEGVTFTSSNKEQMAYALKAAFSQRTIRIPADDAIRADLHSVRKSTSLSGATRFSALRNTNGHADRFWALALALQAVEEQPQRSCFAIISPECSD